jgi:hypothetical protein
MLSFYLALIVYHTSSDQMTTKFSHMSGLSKTFAKVVIKASASGFLKVVTIYPGCWTKSFSPK